MCLDGKGSMLGQQQDGLGLGLGSMLTFKYLCVKFLRTTKAIKCVRIKG